MHGVNSPTEAAAPAFVVFESWAPRTPMACSFVTANAWASMLHRLHAQPDASLLGRGILALHHHKWLSAPAVVSKCTEPRPVPASARASAARHGSPGIWQPRFYDFVVFSDKKRVEKLRYMHRNPVKRGLVLQPEQWVWSSYRYYAYDQAGLVVVNEPQRAELRARKVS